MHASRPVLAKTDWSCCARQLRCHRLMCCGRNKLWWMTPEWGSKAKEKGHLYGLGALSGALQDIPPETQFLLLEIEEGGPYAIILPLISENKFRSTLRPPQNGGQDELFVRMESNSEKVTTGRVKRRNCQQLTAAACLSCVNTAAIAKPGLSMRRHLVCVQIP
eukprot:scaffold189543_cov37-Prasinocladus_malaysianus.AAC.1